MNSLKNASRLIALFILTLCSSPAPFAVEKRTPTIYQPPPPLIAWEFKKAHEITGWTAANAGITQLRVDDDKLKGTATGESAAILSPVLTLQPTVQQVVEIRLKVERETVLHLSGVGDETSSRSTEDAAASLPIIVPRNRRMQTFRVAPFWHSLDRVRRIRIGLPNARNFEIEWMRVMDLSTLPEPGTERQGEDERTLPGAVPRGAEAPSPSPGPVWNFSESAEGWNALSGVRDLQQWIGVLRVQTDRKKEGVLLSPALNHRTNTLPWLTLRAKTRLRPKEKKSVMFAWVKENDPELHSTPFTLTLDDEFQEFTLQLSEKADWNGSLAAVGLILPPDSLVEVDYVRLGAKPQPDPPPKIEIEVTPLNEDSENEKESQDRRNNNNRDNRRRPK